MDPFRHIKINPKTVDPEMIAEVGPQASVVVGLATRRPGDR
jgi:hypothetical protein